MWKGSFPSGSLFSTLSVQTPQLRLLETCHFFGTLPCSLLHGSVLSSSLKAPRGHSSVGPGWHQHSAVLGWCGEEWGVLHWLQSPISTDGNERQFYMQVLTHCAVSCLLLILFLYPSIQYPAASCSGQGRVGRAVCC